MTIASLAAIVKQKVQEIHACKVGCTRYEVGPTGRSKKKPSSKKDEFLVVAGTWYSRYIGPITWYQVLVPGNNNDDQMTLVDA